MRQPRRLVYIEAGRGYYARYVDKARTHAFESADHVEPYWVEMLRTAPEAWEIVKPPEKAA